MHYDIHDDAPLELRFQKADGSPWSLLYNPKNCLLVDPDTRRRFGLPKEVRQGLLAFDARARVKEHHVMIQLGRECNYRCSYCCQGPKPDRQEPPITLDKIARLLDSLRKLAHSNPQITGYAFWGGEPLLYLDAIKELAAGIRSFQPNASLTMITNGSLLTRETADWLVDMKINLGISHDGPRNHNRSGDVLAPGSASREAIMYLLGRAKGTDKVSFNPIFSADSPSQKEVAEWFAAQVGGDVPLGEGAPAFPPDLENSGLYLEGDALSRYMARMLISLVHPNTGPRYSAYTSYMRHFIWNCVTNDPIPTGGMCGGFSRLPYSVDMDGNVLVCHNFPKDYVIPNTGRSNLRGHISDTRTLRMGTLPGWEQRERCHTCPVLPLCRGGCPMVSDEVFEKQCAIRFHHNFALMGWGLFLATGHLLTGVYGDFHHAAP